MRPNRDAEVALDAVASWCDTRPSCKVILRSDTDADSPTVSGTNAVADVAINGNLCVHRDYRALQVVTDSDDAAR